MAMKVKSNRPARMVGCDLEYAVLDNKERFIPAGMLPINGTKGFPEAFPTGGIEIDCTAVELTFPPANNEDAFVENILRHYHFACDRFKEYGRLITKPSVFFTEDVLQKTRFATTMGCHPDHNAWTGEQNPVVQPHKNLRAYGGHVHIEGGTRNTIKACDLTLGMWSTVRDSDRDRKTMYGKAGAYREKQYGNTFGVEYRVMSNFWCSSEYHIRHVWRLTQLARDLSFEVDSLVETFGGMDEIQDIINNNRKIKARNILKSLDYHDGMI